MSAGPFLFGSNGDLFPGINDANAQKLLFLDIQRLVLKKRTSISIPIPVGSATAAIVAAPEAAATAARPSGFIFGEFNR
jgi:hypothetical protein